MAVVLVYSMEKKNSKVRRTGDSYKAEELQSLAQPHVHYFNSYQSGYGDR